MKTKPNLYNRIAAWSLAALIAFAFSCNSDSDFAQNDLDKKSGKSNTPILKTLVRGAALNMANGIDIGPDGNLYVASVNSQAIIVMDKNNGKILDRITEKVQGPDDLVFGPDGSVYWTDIITGEVGRRDPGGNVTKQFVAPGVNPIGFNAQGRLFVALDFLGDGLYELSPELDGSLRTIIECPGGFCIGFLNAFDFGEDGLLYGPLFALG